MRMLKLVGNKIRQKRRERPCMIAGTHYELQYDALNIESIIRRRTGQPAPW
jgi:hypothetical protein